MNKFSLPDPSWNSMFEFIRQIELIVQKNTIKGDNINGKNYWN
jgi:hypothetical protein